MGLLVERRLARRHFAHQGRPFYPAVVALPQLRHRRRQRRPDRRRRLCRRSRPLSSLRFARLPVGASHADLPRAQEARQCDLGLQSPSRSTARPAGNSAPRAAARPTTSTARRRSPKSICSPIRIIPAASRFRCCGTRSGAPSSTTNPPKSSACSIRRSTHSPMCAPTIIRPNCAPKSIASTTSSIRTSITASIAPALPPARRPTKKRPAASSTTFDQLEERLSTQRYLVGQQITEADWRLFTTLIRFDSVYYSHFKCNLRRVADYPNLWNYLRDLYQVPGVAETVSIDQIKRHYYGSQRQVNPTGIVPIGPHHRFRRAARPRRGYRS